MLKIKSILVPIDFSPKSKKALGYAVRLAQQFHARLTLQYVVEPVGLPDFAKSFPLAMENDQVKAISKGQLERVIKEEGISQNIIEKVLVSYGSAFQEIANAARTLKVDIIVISTHGYTGLKHVLLGSTTERVVRHAPCPVLVVRSQEHDFF
jgi:nucleotide-binding universal stress UspA family protein